MTRKPPHDTYSPHSLYDFEARTALLKQERDMARQENERLRAAMCDACRSREAKR